MNPFDPVIPVYDLCIVASVSRVDDLGHDTDSEDSSDSSSEQIGARSSYLSPVEHAENVYNILRVSRINERLSFWNTGCNFNGYYDITPFERVGSENVSSAEGGFAPGSRQEQTAQLSQWNTSCTSRTTHSQNTTNEDLRAARREKFDEHYKEITEREKQVLSRSMYVPVKVPNIVRDLFNRQVQGTPSNCLPPDVFSRMKLFPCRFTFPVMSITCALIDNKCEHLIVASECTEIQVWNLRTFKPYTLETPIPRIEQVTQMLLNPDGQILVASTNRGTIIAYDYAFKKMFYVCRSHAKAIIKIQFAPQILDEVSWLCTMCEAGKIALWPFTKRKKWKERRYYIARFQNEDESNPNSENSDSDNQLILSPSLGLINGIRTKRTIFMIKHIVEFDFTPFGKSVIFVREDNTLQIYALHVPDYTPRVAYMGASGHMNITNIKWSNTGTAFTSCQQNGCAALWNTEKEITMKRLEMPGPKPDWPRETQWSCDDRFIFTIGVTRTVYVWLSENLTILHQFEAHARIRSLNPNPIHPHVLNGELINGGMELWNVLGSPSDLRLDTFEVDSNFMKEMKYCNAEWSVDGTMLLATNSEMNLSLFSLCLGTERINIPYGKVASDVRCKKVKRWVAPVPPRSRTLKRITKMKRVETRLDRSRAWLARYYDSLRN